jgi:protein phosphatase
MEDILKRRPGAEAAARALAEEAELRGSLDNCTALVVDVFDVAGNGLRDSVASAHKLPLPPRLKPGQAIDGLQVQELLHESRATLLYKVARPEDGTGAVASLVLKTLRPEASNEDAIAALAHEEWLARRAVAPCFPQVVGHAGRRHLYYLMTWQPGESLRSRLTRGHRFAPHEVAELGVRLLKGVAALHRLGIVHQLTILDLGVAATDGDDFPEINNPGTPSYMAPETFAGQSADDVSDLYSCGVTLYELLTRKYPYGEIEPFQKPRFAQPAPPTRHRPDTPAWLESVLLKACARDAPDRFETAEEFLLALERGAHRPLASPRRVPLAARNPSLTLKIVAAASLLANLVTWALLKWK